MYLNSFKRVPSIRYQDRVARLIPAIMTRESTSVILLDYLAVVAETEEEKEYLQSLVNWRRRNDQDLKELYYRLTGTVLAVDQETFFIPDSFGEGIRLELSYQKKRVSTITEISSLLQETIHQPMIVQLIEREVWIEEVLEYLLTKN